MLADGFAKGDIKNARDLQSYCSDAKAKHDSEIKGDVTAFECAVGQMPRSPQSLSMVCTERDKQPVEPMIDAGRKCVAEGKRKTRSCHTAGAEAEGGASKADQAQGWNGCHEEGHQESDGRFKDLDDELLNA